MYISALLIGRISVNYNETPTNNIHKHSLTNPLNMKVLVCCYLCVITLFPLKIQGQDLIVTTGGDSLNCTITQIKDNYIYYTIQEKQEARDTLLPMDQVLNHQNRFYQENEVLNGTITHSIRDYPTVRIAISGGLSYRLEETPFNRPKAQGMHQYIEELRLGYSYGIDLTYYYSKVLGFGLKYTGYKSKKGPDNVYISNGYSISDAISDDITIGFIGPFLSARLLSANKVNSLYTNIGIGYSSYTNHAVAFSESTYKGHATGFALDIGYDIGVSRNFAVGLQASLITGAVTMMEEASRGKKKTHKLDKENYEGLSRVEFSIGLRFIK